MSNVDKLLAEVGTAKKRRAELIPDDFAALRSLMDVYLRLKEMGWNDAVYCPKDGTVFECIEVGSTGIHKCVYHGEWPTGGWLVMDSGDLFPSRPILYRAIQSTKLATEQASVPAQLKEGSK
ncbi:MAG: hypothetical protein ACXU8A_00055 [Burkholderiaceae bacterium]